MNMESVTSRKFGKYELLERVANGGMAQLFRARVVGAEGFEKTVAIKKIHPHLCEEEDLVLAFIDEARLAARLQHPNILPVYDFGRVDDAYFIGMEFLDGLDLKDILEHMAKDGVRLGLEFALFIVAQVCSGLQYAHNLTDDNGQPLNIIHRDITPANIFITVNGEVKIIDFGIARAESHNRKTSTGLIRGKLRYISPEQAVGGKIDYRADIYSLGVVLYEMLAGCRMFDGEFNNVLEKVKKHDFVPAAEAFPDLDADIYQIVNRAIAVEPAARYQSCEDMLLALEALLTRLTMRPSSRSLATHLQGYFGRREAAELPVRQANKPAPAPVEDVTVLDISEDTAPTAAPLLGLRRKWEFPPKLKLPALALGLILLLLWLFSGGDNIYTAYNIWLNDPAYMKCINYKIGDDFLPASTRIAAYTVDKEDDIISFKTSAGKELSIKFVPRWHPGQSVDSYAKLMFTAKKFSKLTRKMNRKEIKAIKAGEIETGMSRAAVIATYGYPPEHVTPRLSGRVWTYWLNRVRRQKVCFADDEQLTTPCW